MRELSPTEFGEWIDRQRARGFAAPADVEAVVARIVAAVRERGDEALREFGARFDGVDLHPGMFEVSRAEIEEACRAVDPGLLSALRKAAERIEAFHRRQLPSGYRFRDAEGNTLGQVIRPLERVGVYVPGGRAAYPSSVLMGAIPARIAGVGEVVVCTPPGPEGRVQPAVLAAAAEAGATRVFRVGGAQAVAAMAYGTGAVPRVDKVVGPGNIYVTVAKRMVFGAVDIDGLHGPSEVAVIADDTADPAWVAADLLAQAEHDPLAVCVLLTPSASLAAGVRRELAGQLAASARREVSVAALERQGTAVLVANLGEAIDLANRMAPEHLELMVSDPLPWLERIRNAGAVFLGHYAPVPAGDYAAGTNHVLPTGGTARFFSGLGVLDFVKTVSYFLGTPAGTAGWAAASRCLAEGEGLPAHAEAVARRMKGLQGISAGSGEGAG